MCSRVKKDIAEAPCPAGSCCHRQRWHVTKIHLETLEASNESRAVVYNYMSLDNVMLVLECMWASKLLLEWMDCKKTIRAERPTSSPVEVFRLRLEVPLRSTLLWPAHKSLLNGGRSVNFYGLCYEGSKTRRPNSPFWVSNPWKHMWCHKALPANSKAFSLWFKCQQSVATCWL